MKRFIWPSREFESFSVEHMAVVITFVILLAASILLYKAKGQSEKRALIVSMAWMVFISFLLLLFIEYCVFGFDHQKNLPLYLCNILCILLPVYARKLSHQVFDPLFYLIIGGTLHAVITPDLEYGFPHFIFFKYWIGHLGLVYVILLSYSLLNYKPTARGLWQAWLLLQSYFVIILGVNALLSSNYLYLNEKPPNPTLLDVYGPWPYYIFVVQLIVIPYFYMLYYIFRARGRRYVGQRSING